MEDKKINDKDSTKVQNVNEGFSEYLKEQNIKAFYEFDKFEFLAPTKDGLGLGEINVIVVEKEIKEENGRKVSIFEFYKDGQFIANTDKSGKLIFSDDYKKLLKSRFKGFL
ncbi:MAG: hypothetical protein HFJ20_02915 [Clostridia bacterium]|nr:hypothetical protein [Clostridia bacterium]